MRQYRRARLLVFCFAVSIVACGSMWDRILGPLREGPHRIQATTAADLQRGHDVVNCLQAWARSNGYPTADYSDVPVDSLRVVRVGGDGIIGYYNGSTFQTDERQSGDSILINEGVSESEYVGDLRHGFVHMAQAYHRELIGRDGDIHWSPPFNACRVPLAVFR